MTQAPAPLRGRGADDKGGALMAAYADYLYYSTVFMGTAIPPDDFPALAVKASAYIDYATMGRARKAREDDMEAVKMAACALAEVMRDAAKLDAVAFDTDQQLSSESVGDWSKNYGTRSVSATDIQLADKRKRETVLMYLAGTKLLHARGMGRCSHTR